MEVLVLCYNPIGALAQCTVEMSVSSQYVKYIQLQETNSITTCDGADKRVKRWNGN